MKKTADNDRLASSALLEKAYPIAIQSAKWCVARFPGLQLRGYTPEDIANEWVLRKSKFLKSTDDSTCVFSSFRYQVFLGVKRVSMECYQTYKERAAGLTPTSFVSLDTGVSDGGTKFVDFLVDSSREANNFDDCFEMEEMLSSLADYKFGSKGDDVLVTDTKGNFVGTFDRSLKSVAELLLYGFKKSEIAKMYGVTKSYVTSLTRGRMAVVLSALV